jgi:hypothetical protein
VAGYFSGKVLSSVTSPVKIEVRIVYAPGRQWRPISTDGDVRETRCGLGDSRGFPEQEGQDADETCHVTITTL